MPAIDPQTLVAEFVADAQRRGMATANVALGARVGALAPDIDTCCQLAALLVHGGHAPAAGPLLDKALARFPGAIELHYWRGNVLRMCGAIDEAERELRGVLRRQPAHRDAAYSLATMLREEGRLRAAVVVVTTLWNSAQFDEQGALDAIGFLIECSAFAEALPIAREARRHWPQVARIEARAGEVELALGHFDEAAATLRSALDHDPTQSAAWLRLAYCRRYADRADADIERFRCAWSSPTLAAEARSCAGFALGKALDDVGDYANAAQVLREANARERATTAWRSDDWRRSIESRLHAPRLPALPASENFVPVFIVGLPRTGTTLVAGTLASEAGVCDRGELDWISTLHAHLAEQDKLRDPAALTVVANLIRKQLRRDDAPARFYVDKNPLNFRYLDFIAALFPNAKIVHCRRALRDTALSLWMQHFAHEDLGFAYDFSAIAEVGKSCQSLIAHWRRVLTIEIFDVDYEAFVAQPRAQQRRLAEFLGIAAIDLEPDFNSKPAAVTTASVWQVRQPVYTHAVGRWRHYADYLPELVALFPDRSSMEQLTKS
ncbi:MAG: tetratricopeptide repeat-containing sulfotransferase family protein [Rudaea sp.]